MLFPCKATVLLFSGKDVVKFLNSVCTNLVDFSADETKSITASVCNNKGKLINHLTLFKMGDFIPAICHMENQNELIDFLNPKILSQEVSIRDITGLNILEYQIDIDGNYNSVVQIQTVTIVPLTTELCITITPIKEWKENEYIDKELWDNWRVENLYPIYPNELNGDLTPYNCGLSKYVHNSKGCYVGQEILTRMYSRNSFGRVLKKVKKEFAQQKFTTTVGANNCLEISK